MMKFTKQIVFVGDPACYV